MNDSFLLPSFGGPPGGVAAPAPHSRHYAPSAPQTSKRVTTVAPSSLATTATRVVAEPNLVSMEGETPRQPTSYTGRGQQSRTPSSAANRQMHSSEKHAESVDAGHGNGLFTSLNGRGYASKTQPVVSAPAAHRESRQASPAPASFENGMASTFSGPSHSRRGATSIQRYSPSDIPPWVHVVLQESDGEVRENINVSIPREATRAALDSLCTSRVSPDVLDYGMDIPAIVRLVRGHPALIADVDDTLAVIVALHVMASDKECREALISSNAVESLASFICDNAEVSPESSDSLSPPPQSARPDSSTDLAPRPIRTTLPEPLWDAAIRTIAKLVVCSSNACSRALESEAAAVLASAALPGERALTRVRAAAGLAALATWSGPRFAVEILTTPNVVSSMAAILTDGDEHISSHLRRATLDGLSVMAYRRGARVILREHGCVQSMSTAARAASLSGDHVIAARSTVAAGQMSGHSLDEFGFLVETPTVDGRTGGGSVGGSSDTAPKRRRTGLAQIKADLLQEEGFAYQEEHVSIPHDTMSSKRNVVVKLKEPVASARENVMAGSGVLPSQDPPPAELSFAGTDPDHDVPDESGTASGTGSGLGPGPVSPLVRFSSATERAALRDSSAGLQKTKSQQQLQQQQGDVWEAALRSQPEDLERENGEFGRVRAYRELASVPIPTKLRSQVWPRLLDVEGLRSRKPGLYGALCSHAESAALEEDIEHTIEADLTRTMPFHCLFWQKGAAPGIDALRRVLRAYAFHVPTVGYCQGMSSIAALILVNSSSEEDAFLMFVRFMSRYGYKNVFRPGFPQYKEWLEEVRAVIAARYPQLNAHFEREGVIPELFLDKAIITCLTHHYPHRALVRMWDVMLLGGSPKIILKACIAVLVISEKSLLAMSFEAIVTYLQHGFADSENGILQESEVENFVEVARSVKLSKEPVQVDTAAAVGQETLAEVHNPPENEAAKSGGALSACFPCFRRSKTD